MKFSLSKKITVVLVLIALSIIPLITLISSLDTIKLREKDWYAGDYDPSYAYLYNSLNIATFRLVGHFDHPGTPMQVTGAAVLWGSWLFSTEHSRTLTEDVISNPEYYLRILNGSVAILSSLVLFLLAIVLWKKTKQFWLAFLFQLSPFVSGIILYNGFTRTSQETMLLMASLMFAALCLIWLLTHDFNEKKTLLMFAIISGFGLASKIIFAPLMLVPLILLKSFENRKKYIKFTIVSFIFFTLPVIPLYPWMGWWIIKLFLHSGIYGTGTITVIEPTSYLTALGNLVVSERVYFILYVIVFLSTAILLLRKWIVKRSSEREFALLLAILITQTIGFLVTAKHPKTSYLLPYEILSITGLIVIINIVLPQFRSRVTSGLVIGIVTIPLSFLIITHSLSSREKLFSSTDNSKYEQMWQTALNKSDAVIGINPGPSPIAAAYFANTYSRNHYDILLKRIYPEYYIFDTYKSQLTTFDGHPITLESIRALHGNKISIVGNDVKHIASVLKPDADLEIVVYVPEKAEVGFLQFR